MNATNAILPADPQPTITIDVDLRNPGQFFACCGLLELAHRVFGCKSLGWFNRSQFFLSIPNHSSNTANQILLDTLKSIQFTAVLPTTDKEYSGSPIIVNLSGKCDIRVDWWLKIVDNNSLRTWGNGTSYKLLLSLRDECVKCGDIKSGISLTCKMTGRLSVDPRSSWTALDAGFSPNDQSFTVATYPMVEFLALKQAYVKRNLGSIFRLPAARSTSGRPGSRMSFGLCVLHDGLGWLHVCAVEGSGGPTRPDVGF